MPSVEELQNPKRNLASEIISSDNKILGTFYKENRNEVSYNELSPHLINALISTEDSRFLSHSGVDIISLSRVLFKTIIGGNANSGGGSTISQQLAKMLFPRVKFNNIFQKTSRKIKEWIIASKLERNYTKEEIITMYLNMFDFMYQAVGIKSSSRIYFNKSPRNLSIEEAAMLIGMAKNPWIYNPKKHPVKAKKRREIVLYQMKEHGYISEIQYKKLRKKKIKLNFKREGNNKGTATYFREFLRTELIANKPNKNNFKNIEDYNYYKQKWGNDPLYGWISKNPKHNGELYNIYKDGLKIHTTIDYNMQNYAEQSVKQHITKLQNKFNKEQKYNKYSPYHKSIGKDKYNKLINNAIKKTNRYKTLKKKGLSETKILEDFNTKRKMTVFSWYGDNDTIMSALDSIKYYKKYLNTGFVSIEPKSGYVKAYVGGINNKYFKYDMVTKGKRQVGSIFKPFIYTLAMQNGYSPCYKVPNVPVSFALSNSKIYTPTFSTSTRLKQFEGKMISLKFALANSLNQVSAKILKMFTSPGTINTGALAAIKIAHNMGITSNIKAYPSICVGTPEIRLSEIVNAYCVFANKGDYKSPIYVTHIIDKDGNMIYKNISHKKESIDEETAYLMLELMKGIKSGTGARLNYEFGFRNEIAGKTGTTNNCVDGWFVGIIPNLVTGIWVGSDENNIHFNSMDGSRMALPIWGKYMTKVYKNNKLSYSTDDIFDRPINGISTEIDCDKFDNDDDFLE